MIRAYGILLRHIQSCAKELFLFFMLMCPNYTSTYFFPMNHVYYEHTLRQKNVPSKMQEDIILPCLLVETFSSSPIPTSFNIWTLFTQPQFFGLTMIDYDFSADVLPICRQTSAEVKLYNTQHRCSAFFQKKILMMHCAKFQDWSFLYFMCLNLTVTSIQYGQYM